jgi:hypothetical protein
VAGRSNTISNAYASVTGGYSNTASGYASSVTGGAMNEASGTEASVTGGAYGVAESRHQTINLPAYDSGWHYIEQDQMIEFTHNLGGEPDTYKVDLEFWDPEGGVHNAAYGGVALLCDDVNKIDGAYWYGLTVQHIKVYRGNYDDDVNAVRVRIWKSPDYQPY